MNRTAVLVLAVWSLVLLPSAAAGQTDITGTWELALDAPTGAVTAEVKVTQTGETIVGELISLLGNAAFKGTFIKDVLAVTAPLAVQGNTINLVFEGKLAGETLSGTVKFGDFGEAPWSGKRKAAGAAATTAASASTATTKAAATTTAGGGLTGLWDVEVDAPGNPTAMSADFKQEGNIVTGTISGPQGEAKVTGTMEGSTLKLDFYAPGGMTIKMTGELKSDSLTGKASIAGLGEMDWKATRAKQ